jgi:uncharacterized protein YbjT (DUF2867 family)
MFTNRILLVTGGTGSLGTAVVRRLLDTDIAEIRVFSRREERQEVMRATVRDSRVRFHLWGVRGPYRIRYAARGPAPAVFDATQAEYTSHTAPRVSDGELRDLLLSRGVVRQALAAPSGS